jgi:lipoprotein-releasing system permease protein
VLTQGVITAGSDYTSGAYIAGIEPTLRGEQDVTTIRQHATSGDFRFASSDGQQRGVVLGRLLADRLQAYVGDTIVLLTMPSSGTAVSASTGLPVPRHDRLEVTGIFDSGLYEYDNAYVYVALKAAQELAGLGDDVTGVEVKTRDRWEAAKVAGLLDEAFAFKYRSVDWQEQNSTLFQALKLEKLGMAVILLLIIIVAAFNIVSNLTMLVADKTKEIGILKAMGMRARSIRRVFLTQGLVIGVVGTLAGLLVGIVASLALGKYKFIRLNPEIYFIDHLPVQTEWTDVLLTVAASIAIAALATIYPAQQAARLYPIDAIRHE